MTMLPQPPPDAPAPPPSEEAMRSWRKWRWIWVTGAISIVLLLLLGLAAPLSNRSHHRRTANESVYNARQIGLSLLEFQEEYGRCPDFTTIAAVQSKTGSSLSLGTKTSNDFFRQFFAVGMAHSESMFYSKTKGTHKPDGVISGGKTLEKGECGFTYLLGATKESIPVRPVLVAPMIPGTDRFDPIPFEGKAVILRIDCSISMLTIDKKGHAILHGRNLMDPHHPIWDGHAPTIAWPDL